MNLENQIVVLIDDDRRISEVKRLLPLGQANVQMCLFSEEILLDAKRQNRERQVLCYSAKPKNIQTALKYGAVTVFTEFVFVDRTPLKEKEREFFAKDFIKMRKAFFKALNICRTAIFLENLQKLPWQERFKKQKIRY